VEGDVELEQLFGIIHADSHLVHDLCQRGDLFRRHPGRRQPGGGRLEHAANFHDFEQSIALQQLEGEADALQ
jgi:hypothetical protein